MEGFIDIHTHILPQVDDGARDIAEAEKMIRMAWEDGTRALFLTPHYRGKYKKNPPAWLRENFDLLQRQIREALPEMRLYLGSELHYEKDAPEKLQEGRILSLNGSNYVLLEFGSSSLRSQVLSAVSEITCCGYTPVIAHAERYPVFRTDPSLADDVLDMGALIQLNAESILGTQGFRIRHYCHTLLRQGKVHFIASDSHHTDWRPPMLSKCWKKVSKKYGQEYASRLFRQNALAILENREL